MKTTQQYKDNIWNFAREFHLIFDEKIEMGNNIKCIGLVSSNNLVCYNPMIGDKYRQGVYNEKLDKIAPRNSYKGFNCLVVVGRAKEAIQQLSNWVDDLKKLNVEIVPIYPELASNETEPEHYTYTVKIP